MTITETMPEDIYHSSTAWSSHDLMELDREGPRYVQERKFGDVERSPSSEDMDIGTAAHKLILEGEQAFDEAVMVKPSTYLAKSKVTKKAAKELGLPDLPKGTPPQAADQTIGDVYYEAGPDGFYYTQEEKSWNANATVCAQWLKDNASKTIISEANKAKVFKMRSRLMENPDAAELLRYGRPELTLTHQAGEACGVPVRCRFDFLACDKDGAPWAIIDYKKTRSFSAFHGQAIRMGYYRQAAFYQWMYQQETGLLLPWYWIPQEDRGSYRARVYQPDANLLRMGHEQNMKSLELIESLSDAGHDTPWPLDMTTGIQLIELPKWAEDWGDDPQAEGEDDDDMYQ